MGAGDQGAIEREIAAYGYTRLPIERSHVARVATLPRNHRDPFDHLLIAQAIVEEMAVITADKWFGEYPVRLV